MKMISFISAGIFIVSAACMMQKPATGNPDNLYDIKWSLKNIYDSLDSHQVNTKAFIRFDKIKQSAGGNGSCNSFGSNATVSPGKVSFKGIFSTKMYCEAVQDIENSFFRNLEKVNRFEIKKDSLYLFDGNKLLLNFAGEKIPPVN
jgi:heat shock protein HslJ